MKMREWLIRKLGGYTLDDLNLADKFGRMARQTEPLPTVRLACKQILRRDQDAMEESLTRENMAYRLSAEMLRSGVIRFTKDEDGPSGIPVLTAEIKAVKWE
jgi:hypothetical protein